MTHQELLQKYPTIFSSGDYSIPDTWIPIVDELCQALSKYEEVLIDAYRTPATLVCQQMKEKFGALRFYVNGSDIVIDQLIRLAEYRTMDICQQCGSTQGVELRNPNGWLTYLCPNHAD